MRMPQGAEWLILLLIVVLLFGAKRLPDAARGLGRSLRIFKAETKALADDDTPASSESAAAAAPAVTAQAATAPAVTAEAAPAPAQAEAAPAAQPDTQQQRS